MMNFSCCIVCIWDSTFLGDIPLCVCTALNVRSRPGFWASRGLWSVTSSHSLFQNMQILVFFCPNKYHSFLFCVTLPLLAIGKTLVSVYANSRVVVVKLN